MESSTIVFAAEVEGLGISETQMRQLTPEEILSFAEKRDFFQRLSLSSTVPPPDFSSSTVVAAAKEIKGIEENELRKGEVVEEQVSFAERLKFFQTSTVEENGSRPSSKIEEETSLSADEEAERSITEKEFGEAKISNLESEHTSSFSPQPEEKVIKTEIQLFLKSGVGGEAIEISKIKDYSESRKDSLQEEILLSEKKEILSRTSEDAASIKQYGIHPQSQISEDWEVIQDEEIKAAQAISITGNIVFVDKEKGTEETWEVFSKEKCRSMGENIELQEDKTVETVSKSISQIDIESEEERPDEIIEELAEATDLLYSSIERKGKKTAVEESVIDTMTSDKQWEVIEFKNGKDKVQSPSRELLVGLYEDGLKQQDTVVKETDWEMLAPEEITEIYEEHGTKKIVRKTVTRTVIRKTFVQQTSEEQDEKEMCLPQQIPITQHSYIEHEDLMKQEPVSLEKKRISSSVEKLVESELSSKFSLPEKKQDILEKALSDLGDTEKLVQLEKFSLTGLTATETLVNIECENKNLVKSLVSEESASNNIYAIDEQSQSTKFLDTEPTHTDEYNEEISGAKDSGADITVSEMINKNLIDTSTIEIAYKEQDENYEVPIPEHEGLLKQMEMEDISSSKSSLLIEKITEDNSAENKLKELSFLQPEVEILLRKGAPEPQLVHKFAGDIIQESATKERFIELKDSSVDITTKDLMIQDLSEITKGISFEAAHCKEGLLLDEDVESLGFAIGGEIFPTAITSTVVTEGGDISIADDSRVIVRRISTVMTRDESTLMYEDDSFPQTEFDSLLELEMFRESQMVQSIDNLRAIRDVTTEQDSDMKENSLLKQSDITTLMYSSLKDSGKSYTIEPSVIKKTLYSSDKTSTEMKCIDATKQTINGTENQEEVITTQPLTEMVFDNVNQIFVERKGDTVNEITEDITSDSAQEITLESSFIEKESIMEQTEDMVQLERDTDIILANVEKQAIPFAIYEKELKYQETSEARLSIPEEMKSVSTVSLTADVEEIIVPMEKQTATHISDQKEELSDITTGQIHQAYVNVVTENVYGEESKEIIPVLIDIGHGVEVQGSHDEDIVSEGSVQIAKPVSPVRRDEIDITANKKVIYTNIFQQLQLAANGKEETAERKEAVSKISIRNVPFENLYFEKEVAKERDKLAETKELQESTKHDESLLIKLDSSILVEDVVCDAIEATIIGTEKKFENEKFDKTVCDISTELEATEEKLIEKLTNEAKHSVSSCEVDSDELKMEARFVEEVFDVGMSFREKGEGEYKSVETYQQEIKSTSTDSHMTPIEKMETCEIAQDKRDYMDEDTIVHTSMKLDEKTGKTMAFESTASVQLEKPLQLNDDLDGIFMASEKSKEKYTDKDKIKLRPIKDELACEMTLELESKEESIQDISSLRKETIITEKTLTEDTSESLLEISKEIQEDEHKQTNSDMVEEKRKSASIEQTGLIEMEHGVGIQGSFSPSPLESLPEIEQVSVSPINVGELCNKIEIVSTMEVEYAPSITLTQSSLSDQTKISSTQVIDELSDASESSVSPISIAELVCSIQSQEKDIIATKTMIKTESDNEIIDSGTLQKEESLVNENLKGIDSVGEPITDDIFKFSVDDTHISTDEYYFKTGQLEAYEINTQERQFQEESLLESCDNIKGSPVNEEIIARYVECSEKILKKEEKFDDLSLVQNVQDISHEVLHEVDGKHKMEIAMPIIKGPIGKEATINIDPNSGQYSVRVYATDTEVRKEIKDKTSFEESEKKLDEEHNIQFNSDDMIHSTKSLNFSREDKFNQNKVQKSLSNQEAVCAVIDTLEDKAEIIKLEKYETTEKEETKYKEIIEHKPTECIQADTEIILSLPNEMKTEIPDAIDPMVESSGQTSDYQSFSPEDVPRSNIVSDTAEAIFPPTFNTKESAYESVNKWMEKEMEIVREMLKDRPDSMLSMEGYESVIAFEGDIQVGEEEPFKRSSPTAESFDDEARVEKCDTDLILQMLNNVSCSEIELAEVRTEDEAPDIEEDISPAAEELCNCTIQEFINDQTVSDAPVSPEKAQSDDDSMGIIEQIGIQAEDHIEHSVLESKAGFEVHPQSSLEVEVGSRVSDDAFSVEHAIHDERRKEVLTEKEHYIELYAKPMQFDHDVSPSVSLLKSEAVHDSTSDTITSTTVLSARLSDEASTNAAPQLTLSEVSVAPSSPTSLPKNCDPTFISISNSGLQFSPSVASDNCFPDGDIKSDIIDSNLFSLKSSKTGSSYESIYDESKLSFNDNIGVNQQTQNKFSDNNTHSPKMHNGFKTSSFENLYVIGKEDKDAALFEGHYESTIADTLYTKHHEITEKSKVKDIENGDKPITTETEDLYDQVDPTTKKLKHAEKYDEPSYAEMEEHTDAQFTKSMLPTQTNGMDEDIEALSFEPKSHFEDDVNAPEINICLLPDEIPIDVTDKPDIEPELESDVKPVVTTPVSERKHKPESKPRRSHIPVYDVTGKYEGPETKHIEPIIIEPEDDKDSLMIDRHHSTPDFRQLAGSDLEAILEDVEPTSDGKDSSLDVGLKHDQSVPTTDMRMADQNVEELTDHSKLPL